MYEMMVLGATFAAAGIARQYGEDCLVIERRAQAGYEYPFAVGQEEALYTALGECRTVFCAEIVSVEKTEDGFVCMTHGVDGFRSYKAKRVVDTRCNAGMCVSKTYNLLVESSELPAFDDVDVEEAGNGRYILRCRVPLACGYAEARGIARRVIDNLPETQRLVLSADEFDYRVNESCPRMENGILLLPSKAYESPEAAFAAGLAVKERADG